MDEHQQQISKHLDEAKVHIEKAMNISIQSLLEDPDSKQSVGQLWESLLGSLLAQVRKKGKENKVNLLNIVSLPKLLK